MTLVVVKLSCCLVMRVQWHKGQRQARDEKKNLRVQLVVTKYYVELLVFQLVFIHFRLHEHKSSRSQSTIMKAFPTKFKLTNKKPHYFLFSFLAYFNTHMPIFFLNGLFVTVIILLLSAKKTIECKPQFMLAGFTWPGVTSTSNAADKLTTWSLFPVYCLIYRKRFVRCLCTRPLYLGWGINKPKMSKSIVLVKCNKEFWSQDKHIQGFSSLSSSR